MSGHPAPPDHAPSDHAPADQAFEDQTFEQLLELLEGVTGQLARGDLGIEAAADAYERAEALHAAATARLAAVQARIERLTPPG